MNIYHWNSKEDGELTELNFKKKLEKLGYDVYKYYYTPGTSFGIHDHDVDKIDAVLSGKFKISIHDEEVILTSGDMLYIPKNTAHSAEVVGDETVVSLDAVKKL